MVDVTNGADVDVRLCALKNFRHTCFVSLGASTGEKPAAARQEE
jgi:hypothetical protein